MFLLKKKNVYIYIVIETRIKFTTSHSQSTKIILCTGLKQNAAECQLAGAVAHVIQA